MSGVMSAEGPYLIQKKTNLLSNLAERVVEDAKIYFEENGKFSDEIYQQLYSIYADLLFKAFDIVDRFTFTKYKLCSESRMIFKLGSRSKVYFLYNDINFCTCSYFTQEVINEVNDMLCEHILALKLAKIVNIIREEIVTNAQLSKLLNNQMNDYLGFGGFNSSDDELT